jgi:nucleoid DNA-binding protein
VNDGGPVAVKGATMTKADIVERFVVNQKRPRKGRNPQTGEEIIITGRKVLTFKASQVLKKTINPS